MPSGHSANLYASQSITLKPNFSVARGGSFTAKVGEAATPAPEDEYNYRYDRIGNLVADKGEVIEAIRWTPYGKVKEVNKASGERISLRYDGAGTG